MSKISIILPTYNSEKYIRESLESVLEQTLEDIEVIVVDADSKDKTKEIINSYSKKDPRIVILNRPDEYVGESRNAALDIATGQYIMFLDSDDSLVPEACQKAYEQISKNNDDMVYFAHNNIYDDNQKIQKFNGNIRTFSKYFNGQSFCLYEIDKPFISGSEAWYKIYNRSFLDKYNIRFGSEKFGEDTSFYIKCIINSTSVSALNENLYNYRKNDTSSCTSSGLKNWKDIFSSRPNCYYAILNSKHKDVYLKTCLPFFINSVIYWYNRWSKLKHFPQKEYYNLMHKFLNLLYVNHFNDIEYNKSYINDYKLFHRFANENWQIYNIKNLLKKIFSVTNKDKHKVISILGITIKLKYNPLTKNIKKVEKFQKLNLKRIKKKVKNKEKIKVAFYVNDSKWKCQNLFKLMELSDLYEPFMLIGKNSCDDSHREFQTKSEIQEIYNSFISKNNKSYYAYDFTENKHIPIEKFAPDIVFYSRQFLVNEVNTIDKVSKFALTCYVPYFIPNSPIKIEAGYDFHSILWKYYVLNEDTKKAYSEVMIQNGKNLVPVGYPLLDSYLCNENNNTKDLVIYAPHWSLGETPLKYATFNWNGLYMLEFAQNHPEIKWVFKPHPLLKNQLIETGFMTPEEVEKYYINWDKIGIKYEGADYIDLFKNSKTLITDCGSFLAEYMPTGNPVILLRSQKATPYNFLGKKVTKYYYQVFNLEELDKTLNNVLIKNRDFYLERRIDMLNNLHLLTNASQNIIDDLNKEFGIGVNK